MKKIFAIIVGAGKGTRMGNKTPKQFLPLSSNQTIFGVSMAKFMGINDIHSVLAIVPEGYEDQFDYAVTGGATRQESVFKGLEVLKSDHAPNTDDIILIHDAARPLVSTERILALIDVLQTKKAATLASPIKDSLRYDGGDSVNRDNLYALQTPQGFHFNTLYDAHIAAVNNKNKALFTDDTSIVEANGDAITIVSSPSTNFKITTKEDLDMARALLSQNSVTKTGLGYDVHAFDTDKPADNVRLCGIDVPHAYALKGHSDADVGLHAITDAILGAIGKGDIGELFPPSDESFKGMDSAVFLQKACDLALEANHQLNNIDITLICEAPKLSKYKDDMRNRIAEICNIDRQAVNVKATTTEKLGFTGRCEGIAAQAIVSVTQTQ